MQWWSQLFIQCTVRPHNLFLNYGFQKKHTSFFWTWTKRGGWSNLNLKSVRNFCFLSLFNLKHNVMGWKPFQNIWGIVFKPYTLQHTGGVWPTSGQCPKESRFLFKGFPYQAIFFREIVFYSLSIFLLYVSLASLGLLIAELNIPSFQHSEMPK